VKRTAVAVGSRNLQETVRKYCPGLVKALGIHLLQGREDVKVQNMSHLESDPSRNCAIGIHYIPFSRIQFLSSIL
jgi:hypothetical protein